MADTEISSSGLPAGNVDLPTLPSVRRSAARAVFDVAELRLAVLALLDQKTLVTCMRLEKGSVKAVAALVYRKIPYEIAQTELSSDPASASEPRAMICANIHKARRAIYCNAVREVDGVFTGMTTRGLQDHFNTLLPTVDPKLLNRFSSGRGFLSHYRPEVYDLIIPPFRRKFPNLSRVQFAMGSVALPRWTVQFGSDHASSPAPAIPGNPPSYASHDGYEAHIEVLQDYNYVLTDPLPKALPLAAAPADKISIRHRVNLSFDCGHKTTLTEDLLRRWRHVIAHSPLIDHVHASVNTGLIPAPLDLFTSLYERQISLGRCPAERILKIRAPSMEPWSIESFERFATVASPSLTSLHIGSSMRHYGDDCLSLVSFADLPRIAAVIQEHLPSLTDLHINMRGIAEAETVCRDMLYPGMLEERGPVIHLTITSNHCDTTLFNTIRTVSVICAENAKVLINGSKKAGWGGADQTYLLNALRSKTPERRHHLAVADFSSVGMEYPRQLPDLRYYDDGRPQPTTLPSLELPDEPQPYEEKASDQR